jgi:hypothetical protein
MARVKARVIGQEPLEEVKHRNPEREKGILRKKKKEIQGNECDA